MDGPLSRPGASFLAELPPGYDEFTRLALDLRNRIVVTHPLYAPLVYDEENRRWVDLGGAPEVTAGK